jgi:uncharacterized membrane protein YccC
VISSIYIGNSAQLLTFYKVLLLYLAKDLRMELHSPEAFLSYTLALIAAAIVSLPAMNKRIGYGLACIMAFALSFVLIVLHIPYPLWFSSVFCLVAYIKWPRAETKHTASEMD